MGYLQDEKLGDLATRCRTEYDKLKQKEDELKTAEAALDDARRARDMQSQVARSWSQALLKFVVGPV